MAAAGGIRAGRAYVEVGAVTTSLYTGLKAAEGRVRAFGQSVQAVGSNLKNVGGFISSIGARFAGAGTLLATPFLSAIRAAGDMAETVSKLEAVFKGDAANVSAWANNYASQVGRSKSQIQGFAADTGAILSGFGFASKDAADLSKTVTQLAVDLGSFSNLKDADALQSLISGLSGQSEPLLKFGVAMSAAAIDAELLKKGIDPETATAAQKAYARLEFILARTTNAQGDAIKTASSFNNQVKSLLGTISDLSVEIGNQLIPLGQSLIAWAKDGINYFSRLITVNKTLIQTVVKLAGGLIAGGIALAAIGAALSGVGSVIGVIGTGFTVLAGAIGFVLTPLGLVTAVLGAAIAAMVDFRAIGTAAFQDVHARAMESFTGIANALKGGDIALAGKILWASLKVEWLTGVTALKSIWADLGVALSQGFADVSTKIAGVMIDLWANLKTVWTQAINGLVGSWGNAIKTMFKAISPLSDVLLELFGIDVAKAADNLDWLLGIGPGGAELQKQQQDQLSAIESDRQTAQQQLQSQANTDFQTRRDNAQAGVASSAAELQAAKDDLNSKLGLAASKVPVSSGSGTYTPPVPGAAAAKTPLTPAGIDKTLERAQRTVETKGTFSAAAIRSLSQGDSVIDAVKEGTKETKKQTDETVKMRRTVEQAGRLA